MSEELRFDERVVIVTGAGGGLGRAYAELLASRGAKVVVNDVGGSVNGEGESEQVADEVVAAIREAGGEAVANYDSVIEGEKIVAQALEAYGRVDVVINNAGILRDKSFHKMEDEAWLGVMDVHLRGAYAVTRAAWPHMREQGYGRVVMTSSASGLYGNFGQANYGAAKLGLLGLAHTLAVEGASKGILVNTVAPVAGSRMTEEMLSPELMWGLKPEYVAPLVALLAHERFEETGQLFEAGAGWFGRVRWQRSGGKGFNLREGLTPEMVAEGWGEITDFSEATYPDKSQEALLPIIQNAGTAPPPGLEFVDLEQAVGYEFEPKVYAYTERDVSLYALAIGAGNAATDEELAFVNDGAADFKALPTFAVTYPFVVMDQINEVPGLTFERPWLLHGEQYLELKRPLPTRANIRNEAKIAQIFDKGSGALVLVDVHSYDEESGEEVAFNRASLFIRGIGHFEGERGPDTKLDNLPPERGPDAIFEERTAANQAMLYRLSSGDKNPLHIDPKTAAEGGFDRPILHGLCTFGFAVRAVLATFGGHQPERLAGVKVRFSEPVFPGETIVTEMWSEGEGRIVFQCRVAERDVVVLQNGVVTLHGEADVPEKVSPAVTVMTEIEEVEEIAVFDEVEEIGVVDEVEEIGVVMVDEENGAAVEELMVDEENGAAVEELMVEEENTFEVEELAVVDEGVDIEEGAKGGGEDTFGELDDLFADSGEAIMDEEEVDESADSVVEEVGVHDELEDLFAGSGQNPYADEGEDEMGAAVEEVGVEKVEMEAGETEGEESSVEEVSLDDISLDDIFGDPLAAVAATVGAGPLRPGRVEVEPGPEVEEVEAEPEGESSAVDDLFSDWPDADEPDLAEAQAAASGLAALLAEDGDDDLFAAVGELMKNEPSDGVVREEDGDDYWDDDEWEDDDEPALPQTGLLRELAEIAAEDKQAAAKKESSGSLLEKPPRSQTIFRAVERRIMNEPALVDYTRAVYQFFIEGPEGGSFIVDLKNGLGEVFPGAKVDVDCTVTMPFDVLLAIAEGHLMPTTAFRDEKLQVAGNAILLARLERLFIQAE